MIRILQVVSSLNINAGMMSVVMNYYRHIDRDKIQFDFLYFYEMEQNHSQEIESMGGKVFFFPNPSFSSKYQASIAQFFYAHRGEYTAVHCHPIWAAEIFANAAKKNGIKHIIAHSHSTKYSDNRISALRNRLLNQFVGFFATEYIGCSPEAAYLFGKSRVRSGKVFILRNAIETDRYSYSEELRTKIREELSIPGDYTVLGHVGRLSKEKNQKFLIDVFLNYLNQNPAARLLIVGDGPLKTELEDYIHSNGADNSVIMTGKRRDVTALLSAMDVFLLPSLFEGAPVSAIESQACGLPTVLSSNITKSVQTTLTTYLPLSSGPDLWAQTIVSILQENRSRGNSEEISEAGFDISKEALRLENYYLALN